MNRLPIIAAVFLAITTLLHADAVAFSEKIQDKITALRDHKMEGVSLVEGSAVGFAGTPGLHSKSHAHFMKHATEADLKVMLADASPAVRIMAAHCIISHGKEGELLNAALMLEDDDTKIMLMPGGCGVQQSTVGEVVKQMQKNAKYLL